VHFFFAAMLLLLGSLLPLTQSPEAQARVDRATEEQRRAVKLYPNDAGAYRRLADVYIEHKFMRAASEALRAAVELAPRDASGYLALAPALRRTGDTAGPIAAIEWALALEPNNAQARDGHFRNTLHNDPYDNFLCQARGRKHVLLWPPEAADYLYYANRRDIQAKFLPEKGEFGRRDTGIVSTNTAEVNGADPDLKAFPKYAEAAHLRSYLELRPADCLFLPSGWHHHVFSEADADDGYNLATNMWVWPLDEAVEASKATTLGKLVDALAEVDREFGAGNESCAAGDGTS
jgi:tetratricopeptide (TPR) repeat protein